MINYFCLFCYCCLNLLLCSTSVRSECISKNGEQTTVNEQQIKDLKTNRISCVTEGQFIKEENNQSNINTDDFSDSIDHGNFITGLWRGFHESDGLKVYYGYQFRPDGSFIARHRIYQNRETVEDITWQGEWLFQNSSLKIIGFNLKDKTQQATFELKLTDTFKLAYETGSLSDAYHEIILNKIGY
ncbi:MAG: hypothetical protein QNJ42_20160 [Crocosphaera sp.]|nr:hypothetical protein [Crocosphaera sp.]